MLDFSGRTYNRLLGLAVKYNIVNNCREYPSLVLGGETFSANKIHTLLRDNFDIMESRHGLYVHFPFCDSRCSFCKYYSEILVNDNQLDNFLEGLEKELGTYKINFKKKKFTNLFLGGGTPTLLDETRMEKFLKLIYKYFSFHKNAQQTIEGTPDSLNASKLRLYRDLGINRISIGLQSSNNHVLRLIGRRHNVKDVFKSFELVRKSGIKYIGTELIWGLPGESLNSYLKTFDDLIKLSPDFIEGYLLTTGGRVRIDRSCPPGVTLDELITIGKEKLLTNGYRLCFEGNFLGFIKKGIPTKKAVNQNTDSLYRHQAFVLGVGPGASSHFRDSKYIITSDFNNYYKELNKGQLPPIRGIEISKDNYKRHYIISQIGFFRRLYKEEYKRTFGNDLDQDFPDEIHLLKKIGIVKETSQQYRWNLSKFELGHKDFYMHILQYWYHPQYTQWIIDNYLS